MAPSENNAIARLAPGDQRAYAALMALFGEAFDQPEIYTSARPDDRYVERLLADPTFIALVAWQENVIVGGLVAYELKKFEQERSELYIYDLAVAVRYRRQGVATALIKSVCEIATACGAWTVSVQADAGDEPAIALYSRLGEREPVMHFDIAPA